MFAAVPTAHQPCGANGCQLSPPRDGSAIAIADAITTTSTDASARLKSGRHAQAEHVRCEHAPEHAEADRGGDRRTRAGEVGDVVPADQRYGRPTAENGGDEPAAGDGGRGVAESLAHIRRDAACDGMAHTERCEGRSERR